MKFPNPGAWRKNVKKYLLIHSHKLDYPTTRENEAYKKKAGVRANYNLKQFNLASHIHSFLGWIQLGSYIFHNPYLPSFHHWMNGTLIHQVLRGAGLLKG